MKGSELIFRYLLEMVTSFIRGLHYKTLTIAVQSPVVSHLLQETSEFGISVISYTFKSVEIKLNDF